MAPTIEAETADTLAQLNSAEKTASSLEARIDDLNSTLDNLLEQLEKGGYVSSEALRQISAIESQIEASSSQVETAQEGSISILAEQEPAENEKHGMVEPVQQSSQERQKEKQQQDKLLDMMDG